MGYGWFISISFYFRKVSKYYIHNVRLSVGLSVRGHDCSQNKSARKLLFNLYTNLVELGTYETFGIKQTFPSSSCRPMATPNLS